MAESTLNGTLSDNEDKGNVFYLYIISLIACAGGLMFGFDLGVISGALPFITEHFGLKVFMQGFTVSVFVIGCIFGAMTAGGLSDRFGRRNILVCAAFLFTVSAIFMAIPSTITQLIIARFVCGIAVGTASVLSPIYIAEIAPANIRGKLVSINQLAIVSGILITFLTNWLLAGVGPNNWRWMFAVGVIPSFMFFIALMFVPESPRFLTKQGKREKALGILAKISGRKRAEEQMAEIIDTMSKEAGKLSDIFTPGFRTALIVGIALAVLSQWCGMATIVYYAPTIFMKAGYESAQSALLANVMIGLINFLFTFVAILSVDRFGRKGLLLIGFTGLFISIMTTGFIFQSSVIGGKIILLPLLFYVAFYCMSVGAVTWVILAEIFPTKIRGTAMSIATMSLWIANFILSQLFPWMIETIGGNAFYMFGVVCFIALLFTWKVIPETKNKTLEEIEMMWMEGAEH